MQDYFSLVHDNTIVVAKVLLFFRITFQDE